MFKIGQKVGPARDFDIINLGLTDVQKQIVEDFDVFAEGRILNFFVATAPEPGPFDPENLLYLVHFSVDAADELVEDEIGDCLPMDFLYTVTSNQIVSYESDDDEDDDCDEDEDDDNGDEDED